jgi:hypothetical protein
VTPRAKTVLQVILVTALASSIVHYTDNTIRFDRYPQDDPKLITRAMIPLSWALFVAFGVYGYALFRRGRYEAAAACLAVFSVSGLISPLHYTSAPVSDFDGLQNTFIWTDFVTCVAVVAFAVWLALRPGVARAVAGSG